MNTKHIGLSAGGIIFFIMIFMDPPAGLEPQAWSVAAIGILMAIWWMTEAISLYATSLLPVVLFPLCDVMTIKATTAPYANPLIFLFLGGFMLALAVERWHLHRRLALNIIKLFGTSPRRLIAGFMVGCAFLSMWISNTATTVMMLPIGLSVIALIQDEDEQTKRFSIALLLGIAYSCSLGGMGTLIGTPTNAMLVGFMDEAGMTAFSFTTWMLMAVPLVFVGLFVIYFVLTRFVFPITMTELPGGDAFLTAERKKLGKMSTPEFRVAIIFGLTAICWVSRSWLSGFIPNLSDSTIAMAGAMLLFMIPAGGESRPETKLLNWEWANKLPWGVLLLFGGGLSLANAIKVTGLAGWIGESLVIFSNWPAIVLVLVVIILIVFLTELTSNMATAAAFLPILGALAPVIDINPLFLMVPATLAASCAFMLPVATAPNAIVYGTGFVQIKEMMRAGLWLNLAFIALLTFLSWIWLPLFI